MKVSAFDLNHVKALHFLLEEAHVGRAARHLGITPAAASNALRRLRDELGDGLLVKSGRGLVRTRLGEDLRGPARDVVAAAEQVLRVALPFHPNTFKGEPIALAEHVAALLVPELDRLARARAPMAKLSITSVPLAVTDWLERTGGVLISPSGTFAAASAADRLSMEPFYEDRYVCVLRRGHPLERRRWNAHTYAAQEHVVVTPRGRSQRSDVDEQLDERGLSRRVVRVLPSFTLALSLVARSDLLTTMPTRCARTMLHGGLRMREVPLPLRPLAMNLVVHPAHANDGRVQFAKQLLRDAFLTAARETKAASPR